MKTQPQAGRRVEITERYVAGRGYEVVVTGYVESRPGAWTGQPIETNGLRGDAFLKAKGFLETTEEIAFDYVFGRTGAYKAYLTDVLDPRD